jgi:hypothetical protein
MAWLSHQGGTIMSIQIKVAAVQAVDVSRFGAALLHAIITAPRGLAGQVAEALSPPIHAALTALRAQRFRP